jgi:hypothetical protein
MKPSADTWLRAIEWANQKRGREVLVRHTVLEAGSWIARLIERDTECSAIGETPDEALEGALRRVRA